MWKIPMQLKKNKKHATLYFREATHNPNNVNLGDLNIIKNSSLKRDSECVGGFFLSRRVKLVKISGDIWPIQTLQPKSSWFLKILFFKLTSRLSVPFYPCVRFVQENIMWLYSRIKMFSFTSVNYIYTMLYLLMIF